MAVTVSSRQLAIALVVVVALSTGIGFAIATFTNPSAADAQKARVSVSKVVDAKVLRELRKLNGNITGTNGVLDGLYANYTETKRLGDAFGPAFSTTSGVMGKLYQIEQNTKNTCQAVAQYSYEC